MEGEVMQKLIRINVPVPKGRVVLQCIKRDNKLHVVTLVCDNRLLKLGGFEDIILKNRPDMTIDALTICLDGDEFGFMCDDKPTLKATNVVEFLRTFKTIMSCLAMDILDKFDILSNANDEDDVNDKLYARLATEWKAERSILDNTIFT